MKLLCTIQQGSLATVDGAQLTHRLYFDFLTRIGIDGRDGLTPHIGPDGNWWRGTENTGVPATACRSYETHENFPVTGMSEVLYLDRLENKLYRWDQQNNCYQVIGKHYDQIAIIDGGTA